MVAALVTLTFLSLPATAVGKAVAVELTSSPAGIGAGEPWSTQLRLAAEPEQPPTFTIRNLETGEKLSFRATPAGPGTFDVHVVFPVDGDYAYEVFDAVTGLTHALGAVTISDDPAGPALAGQPGQLADEGAFPLWQVVVGVGALVAFALALTYMRASAARAAQ